MTDPIVNTTGARITTTMQTEEGYEIASFIAYISCSLLGVPGNILALWFFSTKSRDLATLIYIFITAFDILVSVLMFPISLQFLYRQRLIPLLNDTIWFCTLLGILWWVASLMTIFLVAIVSITRCICIVFPLAKLFLKKSVVVGVIVAYIILTTCQATIPFWINDRYYFLRGVGICIWTVAKMTNPARNIAANFYMFQMYGLIPLIVLSSIVTVWVLRRPKSMMSQSNYNVTMSILCFTSLYIMCNIPTVMYQVLVYIDTNMEGEQFVLVFYSAYAPQYMVGFTVGANSALNPLLYCWRTKPFRRFIARKFEQLRSVGRGREITQRRSTSTQDRYVTKRSSPFTLTTRTPVTTQNNGGRHDLTPSPVAASPFLSPILSPQLKGQRPIEPIEREESGGIHRSNFTRGYSQRHVSSSGVMAGMKRSRRTVCFRKETKGRETTHC